MTRLAALALILAPAIATVAAPAAAQVPLAQQTEISEGLIAAAIAYEIGDKCDSLDARLLRGIAFLNGLRDRARELGYSRDEIQAYLDDRVEKDRLEAEARARLAAMGGVLNEWDTYCAVGQAEIAAQTRVGWLLR